MRIPVRLVVLATTPVSLRAPDVPRPPSIIYIMADDLGYGHIGPFGQKKIRTPNLDGMDVLPALRGEPIVRPGDLCRKHSQKDKKESQRLAAPARKRKAPSRKAGPSTGSRSRL